MDVYGDDLRSIVNVFQRAGFTSFVRGEGSARFVYAEHIERAVEVYRDGDGFTVEFFEQPHEVSVRDNRHDTAAIAAEQAVEWLSRHDNVG